jgi:hypothetical protein
VSEEDFDRIFDLIKKRKITYWADPGKNKKFETYTFNGGRGLYFEDPSKHLLEIQTKPYF